MKRDTKNTVLHCDHAEATGREGSFPQIPVPHSAQQSASQVEEREKGKEREAQQASRLRQGFPAMKIGLQLRKDKDTEGGEKSKDSKSASKDKKKDPKEDEDLKS